MMSAPSAARTATSSPTGIDASDNSAAGRLSSIPLLVYPVHSASSQVLVTRSLFASQSQMYWFAGVVMGTSSPGS